jgi:hypothetical protein
VVADKGCDTRDFVAECRHVQMTLHGYAVSQTKRKRIEGRLDG